VTAGPQGGVAEAPAEGAIRVLVVDDSFPYRMFLRELIEAQADMTVVGESGNGALAAQRVHDLAPDVVLMDVRMPGMDGIEAARRIVASGVPTRVIVISAFHDPDALKDTLKVGVAVSYRKQQRPNADWNEALLASIRRVAGDHREPGSRGALLPAPPPIPRGPVRAILIGASTGGPQAVATVLGELPKDIGVPILIVVHLADHFGETLSEWMRGAAGWPVELATDGAPIGRDQVLLAPAGAHLTVQNGRVVLSDAPFRHSVRPSVDVLFESAAREFGPDAVGVLLTGMGRDGARGLLTMKEAGAVTLVQDEATSAVFGMPAEAIRLKAMERVLPLSRIAAAIAREVTERSRP
jgi:two-component system chemotaxis response regulator CheB